MARTTLPAIYSHAAATAIRASFTDRSNVLLQVVAMVVNNGFMLALWFMFFAGFHSIGGWRLSDMALLYGMIMSMVGVAGIAFGGYRDMAATILSGEIDALLTQPRPVLLRLLSRDSIPSAWGDLLVSIVILSAFADLGWRDLPMLILGWLCGFVVYLAAAITFASLAFWLSGARSLARDLTEFVILVSSYPGSIYSGASRLIVFTVLPAGFIVLAPVRLLRHPELGALGVAVAAAVAYSLLAAAVFQLGLRRYRQGSSAAMTG